LRKSQKNALRNVGILMALFRRPQSAGMGKTIAFDGKNIRLRPISLRSTCGDVTLLFFCGYYLL
jgi:hypothetical protein